jgi:hypothetical protein
MRLAACLLFLVLGGCSALVAPMYTSTAPDGVRKVMVKESWCFADCAVDVVLAGKWRNTTIASGNDCLVEFAHAAWQGSVVSVFVDGLWCGKIRVAYDTATGKHVDFASTEAWLRRDIVSAYQITPQELATKNGDVLAWVTYDGDGKARRATTEFQARHRKRPR